MLRKILSIFLLLRILQTTSSQSVDTLNEALLVTENYFQQLKTDYAAELRNGDVTEIKNNIKKFVQRLSPIYQRRKRHLDQRQQRKNGIGVLKGFAEFYENPAPNVLDISVFVYYSGIELKWFVATLNSTRVTLFLYNGNRFEPVGLYSIADGSNLIAECSELGCVLIVSKLDGQVIILRLQVEAKGFILRRVQYLENLVKSQPPRLAIWHGMNQMYLGIATRNNVTIYHWLGEHFDSIQVLNYAVTKFVPLKIGGSLYLVVLASRGTIVLKFFLHSNEFIPIQRLPLSGDVESFMMERGHRKEHYLALTNSKASVVYKFGTEHFVPFQEIAKADQIASIANRETILLFALTRNQMKIHQYDGWKFVEIGVTMSNVDKVYPNSLDGENIVLLRHTNGTWKFNKLIWRQQKTWKVLREEIKSWCRETIGRATRLPPVIPELKGTVKILRGHVAKLYTGIVNGRSTKTLTALTKRIEKLRSILARATETFAGLMPRSNPRFVTIQAPVGLGNCIGGCHVGRLSSALNRGFFDKLAGPNVFEQVLKFENVRVDLLDTSMCPKPAVLLKNVTVKGRTNGMIFESIEEEALKINGDQKITEEHGYSVLYASSGSLPLGIATRATQQNLHVHSLKAKALNLRQGGILLPLHGESVTMNDLVTVARARITGPVNLRGGLRGNGLKDLMPMIVIDRPLYLFGSYALDRAIINDQATALDVKLANDESLLTILNEAIRLDEDVPVHLKLSNEKTFWNDIEANVSVDWIRAPKTRSKNNNVVNISGRKSSPRDLFVTSSSYEALPTLRVTGTLCADEAVVPRIHTTSIVVGRASVKNLKATYVLGAADLSISISDTAMLTRNLDLAEKTLSGVVDVKNASVGSIYGADLKGLLEAMINWREPSRLRGLPTMTNLMTTHLVVPNGFVTPLVDRSENFFAKGAVHFDTLNNVNLSDIAAKILKLDDRISLRNVRFAGGMTANAVHAATAPVDFSERKNMGKKVISGTMTSDQLILPHSFTHLDKDMPVNLRIKGSVTFDREPSVANVNSRNLHDISGRIWLVDKSSMVSSRLFTVKRAVFNGPVKMLGSLNSQSYGPWIEAPKRLLSKTKNQQINEYVYLRLASVPNILSGIAMVSAPPNRLNRLIKDTLKNTGSQILATDMRFQKLIIPDDFTTDSKINGRNLSTDVVRADVEFNVITGKKILRSLNADSLNGGLNFSEWHADTMREERSDKSIVVVTGSKTLTSMGVLKPLRIDGLLNDRRIDDVLLKSTPQEIGGMKMIRGKITTPQIRVVGSVNDVNLTTLVSRQLKKNTKTRYIKSAVAIRGNIMVAGHAAVNGLYRGVELKKLNELNAELKLVSERMKRLESVANAIDLALSRRAFYWNKLELVEQNSTTLPPRSVDVGSVNVEGLGNCRPVGDSLICDGDHEEVRVLLLVSKPNKVLFSKVVQLSDNSLAVIVTSYPIGGAWIYSYDKSSNEFQRIAGLHLPGASQASAVVYEDSLWLAVQLPSDTIILRYEPWNEFEEFTLPGSKLFFMEISPTGELLIQRSDGVWRLGGLSGPRCLSRVRMTGEINTYVDEGDYLVQLTENKTSNLFRARYVGN